MKNEIQSNSPIAVPDPKLILKQALSAYQKRKNDPDAGFHINFSMSAARETEVFFIQQVVFDALLLMANAIINQQTAPATDTGNRDVSEG